MDQLAQLLMNRQQGTGQAQATGAPSDLWSNTMGVGSSMAGPVSKPQAPQAAANYAAVNQAAAPAAQMAPPVAAVAAGPKQLPSGGMWGGILVKH
jgi:hypothetical protein